MTLEEILKDIVIKNNLAKDGNTKNVDIFSILVAKESKSLTAKALIDALSSALSKEQMIELIKTYDEIQNDLGNKETSIPEGFYEEMPEMELAAALAAIYGYSEDEPTGGRSLLDQLAREKENLLQSLGKSENALTTTSKLISELKRLKEERDSAAAKGIDWVGPKSIEDLLSLEE